MTDENERIRLQKVLAAAGIASRRASEELIDQGRVEVNGSVVTEQGTRVDPQRDVIRVDGSRIPPPRHHRYLVLNKPRGVVTTMDDPEGRRALDEFLPRGNRDRLFHVGRLDTDSDGLILLTNDGDFAHRMSHPSWQVPKTYLVEAAGVMDNKTLKRLGKGVTLDDGPVKPDHVKLVSRSAKQTLLTITLHEGRNRVVRRMMDAVGHPVDRLARVSIGPVKLGQLPVGETRDLTREELGALLDMVGL